MYNNHIGPEGARALAKALRVEGCPLTLLDIGSNTLADEGVIALAIAAKETAESKLAELRIYNCKVTATGAQRVVQVCRDAPTLNTLNLSLNQLITDAVKKTLLAEARKGQGVQVQL